MGYASYSLGTNGTTQYVKLGDCHPFEYNNSFTQVIWFRTLASSGYLVSKMDNTPTGYGAYVGVLGEIRIRLFAGVLSQLEVATDSTGWNDDAWHCLAWAYDGAAEVPVGVTVWIDGEEQVLTVVSDTLGTNSLLNAAELNFSGRNNGSDLLACRFTEILFYSAALDTQQVGFLYSDGNTFNPKVISSQQYIVGYWRVEKEAVLILDSGLNAVHGTPFNMTNTAVSVDTPGGVSTKSLTFNGTNQYGGMGNVLGYDRTSAFSMSCWFKSTQVGSGSIMGKLFYIGYALRLETGKIYVLLANNTTTTNWMAVQTPLNYNDGVWHHVLVTYSGSSNVAGIKVYIDGALIAMTTVRDTLTSAITSTEPFQIGYGGYSTSRVYYEGLLDEVAVWSVEQTALEAAAIYNLGVPTDLLTLSSASSLAGWWRLDNEFELAHCSDYGIHPSIRAKQGAGQVQRVPCSKTGTDYALLSYLSDMRFREVGPGGVAPHCLSMASNDTVCHIGRPPNLLFNDTSRYTVSAWFRCTGGYHSGSGGIIGACTSDGWYLAIGSDGKLRFMLRGGFYWKQISTTTLWHDGNWHHVLASKAGDGATTMSIWVDGVAQPRTIDFDHINPWVNLSHSVLIGVDAQSRGLGNLRGGIADIALYNVALGLADAVEQYNGGVPLDLLTLASATNMLNYWRLGNVPGVLINGALQGALASRFSTDTPGGVARRSLVIDSGKRVDVGTGIRLERDLKFSWSIWFKSGVAAVQIIIGKEGSGRIGYYVYLGATGAIDFALCNTSTNRMVVRTVNGGWNDRNWHHLVVTHGGVSSASSMAVYVDGVLEAVTIVTNALTQTITTGERLYFGARNFDLATTPFRGLLAEPVLFGKDLALAEVNEMYNGGVPVDPATTSMASFLISHWSFGDGYNPGVLVSMGLTEFLDDAPLAAVPIPTEKVWVTEDQYDLAIGSNTEVASRIIHLDWKNKLAAHGWTVIGSGNGTIYEYEGETSGGVYGGDSTGPFDVWQTQTDVRYRNSDLGQGLCGWVVLRSPLSASGQFWLILWIYANWYTHIRAYVGASKPVFRSPGTELCPFFSDGASWHYVALNEPVWHDTGSVGVKNYFSVCEEDGSFVFMRQTKTVSYWGAMTIFMVMPEDRVPPGMQKSLSYNWAWKTVRTDTQYAKWDFHVPGGFTTRRIMPLIPHFGENHTYSVLATEGVEDYFGRALSQPVYLMSMASGGTYSGLSTVIGPVPDVLFSSRATASGSMAPAKAPFAFVSVEGRWWVPGSKEPVFT